MRFENDLPMLDVPDDQIRLESALAQVKAGCQVVARHVGPRTITYQVVPVGDVRVSRVKSAISDISVRLGSATCLCREEGGKLFIELTRDEPEIPNRLDRQETVDPRDILVGFGVGDHPVTLRLEKMPHAILAGSSGSGKSVLMRNIVRSIVRIPNSLTMIMDPKGGADYTLPTSAPGRVFLIDKADHIRCWTNIARDEMDVRQGVRKMPSGLRLDPAAPLVLVFDEIQSVVDDQSIRANLFRILSMGRSAGVHCILATQAPSAKVLGGNEMRVNAPTRIVLKTATSSDSRVALTESGAEKLLGSGDAIMLYDGKKQRIQVPYLSADDMYNELED